MSYQREDKSERFYAAFRNLICTGVFPKIRGIHLPGPATQRTGPLGARTYDPDRHAALSSALCRHGLLAGFRPPDRAVLCIAKPSSWIPCYLLLRENGYAVKGDEAEPCLLVADSEGNTRPTQRDASYTVGLRRSRCRRSCCDRCVYAGAFLCPKPRIPQNGLHGDKLPAARTNVRRHA